MHSNMAGLTYVRWKQYGFTHIVNPNKKTRTWLGYDLNEYAKGNTVQKEYTETFDITLCGNRPYSDAAYMKTDDGKRPLCGTCKKIAEKAQQKEENNE